MVSHLEDWSQQLFFVSGSGREYPEGEEVHQEFPVWAIWLYVLNSKSMSIKLNRREEARLAAVQAWVAAHALDIETNVVLTEANIQRFLFSPDCSYVLDPDFFRDSPLPRGRKCHSSLPATSDREK